EGRIVGRAGRACQLPAAPRSAQMMREHAEHTRPGMEAAGGRPDGRDEPLFGSDRTMGCNMVVALGRATVDGHTLFGHTTTPADGQPALCLLPGRPHAPDETVRTQLAQVPQARQTYRVLCARPPGLWGASHGVNENGVAAGTLPVRTRFGGV